ncbi:PAS domain-containing protein [Nostoc sp. XA013]|nr:PAS domain-containing protein [Nostoc sp. XA013]
MIALPDIVVDAQIADTLHSDISTIISLAELVLRKTGGNAFFVNGFLKTLYAENLLSFDLENVSWQWDITHIEGKNITDNVVELMLGKLKRLPPATQQVLQFAACVGAVFDLSTLSIICESSSGEIFPLLSVAAQSGLIVPTSELDEQLVQDYKFLHDRVQQAAYALIEESHKQVVHLQIGRNLLKKTLPERISERLFEIVDHLNYGIELVADQAERDEIARLNLIAGQKAKAAIAYGVSKKYLATARVWLAASSWQKDYDLSLQLYAETTEVAYLCGNFEQVEYWAAIVLQQAKTVLDSVKVYEVEIQTNMAQNQPLEAITLDYSTLKQQVAQRTAALQKSEATLRDVYDELRLREQELRLITGALPACISYVDADQHHRFINRTYEVWLNCSRDEILGKSVRELVGDMTYQILEPYINQALAGQTATLELEMLLPSGKKYITSTLIPHFDGNAQVVGFYSLHTDISNPSVNG